VDGLILGAVVSTVNLSEVLKKARGQGLEPTETVQLLESYGLVVSAATKGDAILAAKFWEPRTHLSLADRFCLGLAYRLGARAVTADRSWADLGTDVEVLAIR